MFHFIYDQQEETYFLFIHLIFNKSLLKRGYSLKLLLIFYILNK